jgi:hypothetical protein
LAPRIQAARRDLPHDRAGAKEISRMSNSTTDAPLWLQGRDAIVASSQPEDWRKGAPPDYHLSNEVMPKQRTCTFAEASLEATVERLVQAFELEISHKKDPARWLSVVAEGFRTRTNGGRWYDKRQVAERGSYNILIGESPYYDTEGESFESSHDIFHTAFPGGFFWEVLEVYSPPPVVAFKWRHWGDFTGPYKGFAPTGKRIEIFGMTVARCSGDLKLVEVEHFYDNNIFLSQLTGGCPVHKKGAPAPAT